MFDTKISLYSIMLILSLIANVIVVFITYDKNVFSKDELIGALIYENIGIIFGAKMLTLIQNFELYKDMNFWYIGLSSYGGIIGALVLLIFFSILFKKPIKKTLYCFVLPFPLMYAIGKIGCFLAGCCYGIEYNGPLNVTYAYSVVAPKNIHFFPVQLVESILFFLIFFFILNKKIKENFNLSTLGWSFILCGFGKFILDFLRISHMHIILSLNQIISIGFIILGTIFIFKFKKCVKE